METESITIAAPPAIHVGPIINPESNETISIVIPLSAQLTTVTRASIESCKNCNDDDNDNDKSKFPIVEVKIDSSSTEEFSMPKTTMKTITGKPDKSKGCPFPTCSRYGRAFSRAHDLKRHIARHETRKERLCEPQAISDVRTCSQCGESFLNDAILQRHINSIHMVTTTTTTTTTTTSSTSSESPSPSAATNSQVQIYPCHLCKKKYTQINKLNSHIIAAHDKKIAENTCALCGIHCADQKILETHIKEHTASILEAQTALETSSTSSPLELKNDDDGDDFMLEEMLLLNKNPRMSTSNNKSDGNSSGKIRCDYCSKTFKTKWTLSSHVAAHEGRYQFGCSRCGKKFVRKSHYDGHVRSHEVARPYVCDQCGKTFKELKHRREHTKRKHPGNQNAIQNLLDSISACVAEEAMEQAKFTLVMPMNFTA